LEEGDVDREDTLEEKNDITRGNFIYKNDDLCVDFKHEESRSVLGVFIALSRLV
jgi:hypothetical protein